MSLLQALIQETQASQANKDRRFEEFKRLLTIIADQHAISPHSLAILLESGEWRELYEWKEAPEFIERIAVGEAR